MQKADEELRSIQRTIRGTLSGGKRKSEVLLLAEVQAAEPVDVVNLTVDVQPLRVCLVYFKVIVVAR